MSIEREYGKHFAVCDICGEESEKYDSFDEVVNGKKSEGWVSRKEDGGKGNKGYYDVCPDCQRR